VHRLLAVTAAALALGLATTACNTTDPAAAKINGTTITQRQFERELKAFAADKPFVQAQTAPVAGAGNGSVSGDFARFWLGQRVALELIHETRVAEQISVTDADRTAGETTAKQRFAGTQGDATQADAAWAALPTAMRTQIRDLFADREALARSLPPRTGTVQDLLTSTNDVICLTVLPVQDDADAKTVLDQISSGAATFDTVAQSRLAGSSLAASGGRVLDQNGACPASGLINPTVIDQVKPFTVGKPGGPVTLNTSKFLVLVTQVGTNPLDAAMGSVFAAGKVTVDPRYGVWNAKSGQIDSTDPNPASAPAAA
jgi:hypothetical protein